MLKPLLIFATILEAQATLDHFKMTQTSDLWTCETCDLLICGIGSLSALASLSKTLQKTLYTRVYNLGCCADLLGRSWGQLYTIICAKKALEQSTVVEHSRLLFERTFPMIQLDPLFAFQPATLLSVDCPVHDIEISVRMKADGDLVDMEGYALAWLAQTHQIPLNLIKCTSDFGNAEGPAAIRHSLLKISERLCEAAQQLLPTLKS